MDRVALAVCTVLIVASGAVLMQCGTSFPANVHVWGTYSTAVTLVASSCSLSDGGCYSQAQPDGGPAAFGVSQLTMGITNDGGTAVILAHGADPQVDGTQSGNRFVYDLNLATPGFSLCGCATAVHEVFWGEFIPAGGPTLQMPSFAGTCGEDPNLSPGDWLAGATPDVATDGGITYEYFSAIAVDTVVSSASGANCPCLPCTVTNLITGTLAQP